MKANDTIDKYKARLVTDFRQEEGVRLFWHIFIYLCQE